MRKKETQMDDATPVSAPAPSAASQMLTPLDIQQKEFRVSRRGATRCVTSTSSSTS